MSSIRTLLDLEVAQGYTMAVQAGRRQQAHTRQVARLALIRKTATGWLPIGRSKVLQARLRGSAFGLVTLLIGCTPGGGTGPQAPPPPTVFFSLISVQSAGVGGSPMAGALSYAAGSIVTYSFVAQPMYENLRVLVDGVAAPPAGTITMDRDHKLVALADRAISIPTAVERDVTVLSGQLQGLITGAIRPMDAYRATAKAVETLRGKVPKDSIPRLLRLARIQGYSDVDAPVIAKALQEIGDSLSTQAQPSAMSVVEETSTAEVFYVYINGIRTDFNAWQDTWISDLTPLVRSAGYADPSKYPVAGYYNPTDNTTDQGELAAAVCLIRSAEGWTEGAALKEDSCKELIMAVLPRSDLKEGALQVLARLLGRSPLTPTAAALADFLTILLRNARLVLVAHSQGNLFADAAYRELERRGTVNPGCIGTVSIAPPQPLRPLTNGFAVSAQFVAGQKVKDILLQIADIGLLPGLESIHPNANELSAQLDEGIKHNPLVAGPAFPLFTVQATIQGGLVLHKIREDYLGANAAVTILALQEQTESVLAKCVARVEFPEILPSGRAGSPLPPLGVRVRGPRDTPADQATVPIAVKLGVNPTDAQLTGTLSVSPVNGVAWFSDLVIDKAGTGYTLVAVTPGAPAAESAAFSVGAASPAPGSFLSYSIDSTFHSLSGVEYFLNLYMVDASSTGRDVKIGALRTGTAPAVPVPPWISRSQYPFMRALAECPNGQTFTVSTSDGFSSSKLWSVDRRTAIVAQVGDLIPRDLDRVAALSCDESNQLFAGTDFLGGGTLFRIDRVTATATGIGRDPAFKDYQALGAAFPGPLYAVATEWFSNPVREQLVRVGRATGIHTPVVAGQYLNLTGIRHLAWRGGRLFGLGPVMSARRVLVELDPVTGLATPVRNLTF